MTNASLLEKTVFYREGRVVPVPTSSFMGEDHTL
jgi:hypothetical protein